jgi:hypothetical protein
MNWIQRNFKTIVYIAFLVPILAVAGVSISHVTTWYSLSNPISWAIYLSIGIEIAALSALAAISAKMGRKVYFPFGIVTLIQFIGNIFFAYQFIDVDSEPFKDWVELVDPIVSYLGVESGDIIGHKRFLSLFAGGMLPIISLSFLHMLVKFEEDEKENNKESVKEVIKEPTEPINVEELSIEAARQEAEIEKENEQLKFTPTKEQLDEFERLLIKKYQSQEEPVIETKEDITEEEPEPISSTQEDLKKLEEELIRINEEKFETLKEETENNNTGENPPIKRLNYTKRDVPHTKIQSI